MSAAPIVLVDGSSYLFRAYHGLPPLVNSKGMPTGAVKGVINMIRSLATSYPGSEVVVIFDAKGPTFRNEIYTEYKANRPPMDDDLRVQIQPIHDIIKALGLPIMAISGVEADDVIGTYARQASEQGIDVVISTGDKDMAQLVTPHVTLLNTMKNETLDVQGITDKYGFGPEYIIDYLALMGDKSDNIPGVPGVGDKTATALIAGLGGISDIYQRLDDIKDLSFRGAKTMSKKLEANKELAELSYTLATIKCDVELEHSLLELKQTPPDKEALLALYQELEFKGWVGDLGGQIKPDARSSKPEANNNDSGETVFPSETHYRQLTSIDELKQYLYQSFSNKVTAIAPIFDGKHYMEHSLIGLALSHSFGDAVYVDCRNEETPWQDVKIELSKLTNQFSVKKISCDLKRWLHFLTNENIDGSHQQNDVQLMAFVDNSVIKRDKSLHKDLGAFGLENLALKYLDQEIDGFDAIAGPFGAKQQKVEDVELEKLVDYACQHADTILRLDAVLEAKLQQNDDLWRVYHDIERPLVKSLCELEQNGAYIDDMFLSQLADHLRQRIEGYKKTAHDLAGSEFSLDSPKQVGKVLFEDLQLPILKKTAKGAPSTNEEVLLELAKEFEIPAIILEYRSLKKLLSTYAEPLPTMITPSTGRIHTSYNQMGAATGRFSSTEPNLQNIPVRSVEGREIRKAFVAKDGYKIVAADYSQVELRIMTHLSQDETLIQAFREGKDIHKATAADIMHIDENEVTSTQRRNAKAINFGLIYGMSAFGLAKQLDIPRGEASNYVKSYFARYPGVKRFMDETKTQAAEDGYVSTIYGRRLNLPDITSSKGILRAAAERTAINAPMQGTAADIIKRAIFDVQNWLNSTNLDAKMIMQVHDELVFEVKESDVDALISGVKFRMSHAASLDVPLVVDVGIGDNWEEAH